MTSRQKKGVGFAVTSALFALCAIVFLFFTSTPDWLATVLAAVAAVANVVSIAITVPTITSSTTSMIFTAFIGNVPGKNGVGRRHKKL